MERTDQPHVGRDDSDVDQELREMFLSVLPDRVTELESAAESSNGDALCVFAHRLKGAAPGYGFDDIGKQAGVLERSLRENENELIEDIKGQVDGLILLCRSYINTGTNTA